MAEPAASSNRASDRGCVDEGFVDQGERPVPIDGGFQGRAHRRSDVVRVRSGRVCDAGGGSDATRELRATASAAANSDSSPSPAVLCAAFEGGTACATATIFIVVFGEMAVADDPAGGDADWSSGTAHHLPPEALAQGERYCSCAGADGR